MPDFRKCVPLWEVASLRSFARLVGATGSKRKVRSNGGMTLTGGKLNAGRNACLSVNSYTTSFVWNLSNITNLTRLPHRKHACCSIAKSNMTMFTKSVCFLSWEPYQTCEHTVWTNFRVSECYINCYTLKNNNKWIYIYISSVEHKCLLFKLLATIVGH